MRSPVTVIEVGPAVIRGADETGCEAIDSIDDEMMLVGDHAVSVDDVWSDVLHAALGGAVDPVVIVHPSGWSRRRIGRVGAAARRRCPEAVILSRAEVLNPTAATIVEIGDDLVVVTAGGVSALPRGGHSVVEAVVQRVGGAGPVAVDAPDGVVHAVPLARAIVAALRDQGVTATVVGPHDVRRAVMDRFNARDESERRRRKAIRAKPMAVMAGAALTVVTVGAVSVVDDRPPPVEPMTMLVEGRVGVLIPVTWTVRRITDGPGSRRLQVVSPGDGSVALHLTQTPLPQQQSVEQVAATLRTALATESDDVFTDFRPDDRRSGRPVVSYRERRGAGLIAWFVFADGAVRIAVGCQSPDDRGGLVSDACDAAVRSAHAVF